MNDKPATCLLISLQKDIEVIGIRLLHQFLIDSGYDSRLLLWPGYVRGNAADLRRFAEFMASITPAMVGISLMSCEYHDAADLTRFIKDRFPDVPVIWGGIHPSIAPEMCLECADYVCIGEGERTLLEFVQHLSDGIDPADVNNIGCIRDGRLVKNPLHPLIEDLDRTPALKHIPDRAWVVHQGRIRKLDIPLFRKHARYRGTIHSVVGSRGCPFACAYCCNSFLSSLYGTRKIRYRSVGRIIDDLKTAIGTYPFIEGVNFQDDCFLAAPDERIAAFCEAYAREIGKPFAARGVPVYLNDRKLDMLGKAGLSWLIVGLQSGSDRTCREIYGRRSLQEDFLRVARLIKAHDMAAFYDIIVDNPYETDEDRLETIQTLIRTPRPFYPQFFSLTFYPGTALTERAIRDGLIKPAETLTKEYLIYEQNTLNLLTRLAAFLPSGHAALLLALYRRNGDGPLFRAALSLSKILSALVFEPLTAFRVILKSQRGDWLPAIRTTYSFLGEGLKRFRFQFRKPSD